MSIKAIIRKKIQKNGAMPLDELIEISMSRYSKSYYRTYQPLGEDGDFITAPEVSQMFGEMIGVWCVDLWNQLSKPRKCNIVEYGAGLGTLIRDLLNVIQKNQQFYDAIIVWIIDINPHLQQKQKELLKNYGIEIHWVDSIHKVSPAPTIVIANEFFDALPVKQYVKQKKEWKENVVVINPGNEQLTFGLQAIRSTLNQHLLFEHPTTADGAVIEESPNSIKIVKEISEYIQINEGGALIIDYGYDINPKVRKAHQYTQTLQAVTKHKYTPVLSGLGESDLSSHVDFWGLKSAIKLNNVQVYGTISQRELLMKCGINIRFNALIRQNPELHEVLSRQYSRLMAINEMGALFKAIAITSNEKIVPLGFHS